MNTDRIEKEVVLRAPLARVWQAISNADEFGQWFGVRFDGPFVEGTSVTGVITPAQVVGPANQGIAAREFDELVQAIRAGATYANVHTTANTGGEIRGQISTHDEGRDH